MSTWEDDLVGRPSCPGCEHRHTCNHVGMCADGPPIQAIYAISNNGYGHAAVAFWPSPDPLPTEFEPGSDAKFEPNNDAQLIYQMAKAIAGGTNHLMDIFVKSPAVMARWSPKSPHVPELHKFVVKYNDIFDSYLCEIIDSLFCTYCYLTPKGRDLFQANTPHAVKPSNLKGVPLMLDDNGMPIIPYLQGEITS